MLKTILEQLGYFSECKATYCTSKGIKVEAYKFKTNFNSYTIYIDHDHIGIVNDLFWGRNKPNRHELGDPELLQKLKLTLKQLSLPD